MRSSLSRPVRTLLLVCAFLSQAGLSSAEQGVEEWALPQIPEPSGVAYHPLRKSVFVVGDEGDIGEVTTDGRLLASRHLGGDLEGIACDPTTGKLYVVREGDDVVLEVRPADLKVARTLTVDRAFEGNDNYLRKGGDGLEGIAVKTAPGDKGPTTFYVVNQYDPAVLAEVELVGSKLVIRKTWKLSMAPLSDVMWDGTLQALVVVSGLWRNATIITPEGKERRPVANLPGFLQEGLARLPDGSFVIAQDVGGLLKWTPAADPFASPQDHGHAGLHRSENGQDADQ